MIKNNHIYLEHLERSMINKQNLQPNTYYPDEFEKEALATICEEKSQWSDAAVFVTSKSQYLMRNVIEKARKNYLGMFDEPYDEITGEKKTWVPMTEWSVESVVKSVDLDTKDVLISPNKISAVNIVPLIRSIILNLFKKIGFGQILNDLTRTVSRDGTVVIKSYVNIDPDTGKKNIKSEVVDILNLWVDPSARDLQEGPVIERSYKSKSQVETYDGVWKNLESVPYTNILTRVTDYYSDTKSQIPYSEVWERWGPIRKSWLTKNDKDKDTWVEGHMVASGIGDPKVIHLIRKNPREDCRKPYEECWYRRLDGRWYGRGVGEMLFDLQEHLNMIVNIRKANNMVLQNGIFLIRKGSGITPDMLSSITAGGGIPVTNINNDIKQLNVQDYRPSSYNDEDRVYLMADRVTSAFDINRGEVGLASASATATLTRDRNIRDTFVLIQEGIGFFIERLIRFQYIPLLKEIMSQNDAIKISGDSMVLSQIDDTILQNRQDEFINNYIEETGFYPEQEKIDNFLEHNKNFLKKMGRQRFINYFKNIFDEEFDIEVHITDEKFNRVVAVQQLKEALLTYSRLPVGSRLDVDAVLREIFDIMGLRGEFFLEQPQIPIMINKLEGPRRLKEMPQEVPSETTAVENAYGIPQQGAPEIQSPQAQLPI